MADTGVGLTGRGSGVQMTAKPVSANRAVKVMSLDTLYPFIGMAVGIIALVFRVQSTARATALGLEQRITTLEVELKARGDKTDLMFLQMTDKLSGIERKLDRGTARMDTVGNDVHKISVDVARIQGSKRNAAGT